MRWLVRAGAVAEAALGVVAIVVPRPAHRSARRVSYVAFAGVVAVARWRGGPLATCGCFGRPDTPPTALHLVLNLVLAAAALAVAVDAPSTGTLAAQLAHQPWAGVPAPLRQRRRAVAHRAGRCPSLAALTAARHPGRPRPRWRRRELLHDAGGGRGRVSSRAGCRGAVLINRSAFVGSAVAVGSGLDLALKPGTAYGAICECGNAGCGCGSTCCSGFSEFCCAVSGANFCPANTVMGGWWVAENSSYCGGPRYYMDCNSTCSCTSGCGNGFGFCAPGL